MPSDRFYTKDALFKGSYVQLDKAEDFHMRKVMRKKAGDLVEIFNGKGKLFEAVVLQNGQLLVEKEIKEEEPGSALIIAQALIAPNKLDFVAEKCAELGASALWLFPGEQSEKKNVSDTLLTRLQNIAIAAAKQSGRLFIMDIGLKPPLKEWPFLDKIYFGSTDVAASSLSQLTLGKGSVFAVGPEKGFSQRELALFNKKHGISLSTHILRTETAALVLLAHYQGV